MQDLPKEEQIKRCWEFIAEWNHDRVVKSIEEWHKFLEQEKKEIKIRKCYGCRTPVSQNARCESVGVCHWCDVKVQPFIANPACRKYVEKYLPYAIEYIDAYSNPSLMIKLKQKKCWSTIDKDLSKEYILYEMKELEKINEFYLVHKDRDTPNFVKCSCSRKMHTDHYNPAEDVCVYCDTYVRPYLCNYENEPYVKQYLPGVAKIIEEIKEATIPNYK
jgi:hypothetical protein